MDSPGEPGRRIRHEERYRIFNRSTREFSIDQPETTRDALTEVLREGAQKLIAEAVQAELEELLEQYKWFRNIAIF